jgi:predicted DNA-binding transcriptional regulator AlpA
MVANLERDLLREKEVAGLLAICTRGVWRLVARGELAQPVRIGQRSVRWRMKDVQAYIERQEQGGVR